MNRDKQKILHEEVPVPCFFAAHFCAALVRLCEDIGILRAVFTSTEEGGLNSFEFVTKTVEALATAHLVSCVDALGYRIACVQRHRALEASVAARRDSTRAAMLERSKSIVALANSVLSHDSAEAIQAMSQSAMADSSAEAMVAVETMAQRRAKLAAFADWEDSLRVTFESLGGKYTNGELEYFEQLGILEYCLVATFTRIDAAAKGRVTWAELASFLADCTEAAPPVGVSDQSALEMLLPAVDQRCKSLDTAMKVCDWASRHTIVALCEENFAQTISVIDATTLQDQKVHRIPDNVGKILGVHTLPRYNAIIITTYSGLRIHDADNFLCKGVAIEKDSISCVMWMSDIGVLVTGHQSGHVCEYDVHGMDRHFFSTNKPYALTMQTRRKSHAETVTAVLPQCAASHFIVTGSMDGSVCMHHHDSGATRVFQGPSVLGLCLAEHLGLILCYGLDTVPFSYSFNVPGAKHIPLGNSSTRGHPKRVVFLGLTDDEDYAVSIDRTGVAKVWALPTNTCVQTISCTEDLDGTAGFLMFHDVAPVGKDWIVIGRRRAFRFEFNDAHFGRVPARACQKAISTVAVDETSRIALLASGLDLLVWDTVLGRLRAHTIVEFLPPPPGAPHGSKADRVSALAFTPDKRSLVVSSDKYCLNIHCAATLVHRSRHVFPVAGGCLIRATPVSMPEDVMCETSCVILSFSNDNPKILMHRDAWSAVTGGTDAMRSFEAAHDPSKSISSGSHTVDRLVLSSASDTLRARLAVVHLGTDTLITSEINSWEPNAAPTVLAVWSRLLNGSWGRSDSLEFTDGTIVSIEVPPSVGGPQFVVILSTGRVAVCTITVPQPSSRKLHLGTTFVHRRGGMAHLLDAVIPSCVAFHPLYTRVMLIGDDTGTVCWYDVGDVLHTEPDSDTGECHTCHALLDDRSRGGPCVWLTTKTANYVEHVTGLTFVEIPRVGWAALVTYGDGEAAYWRVNQLGEPRNIPFVDTTKRIIREHKHRTLHYAYEDFTKAVEVPRDGDDAVPALRGHDWSFYGLPEQVVKAEKCSTDGFGARFNRCSDIIMHASVDSIKPVSNKRLEQTESPQQSRSLVPESQSTVAFASTNVFITGVSPALDAALLPSAAANVSELVDQEDEELPHPRSIRGVGLSHEQTVSLYKEWVFGQQIKLNGADRVERLKILHAIHDSTASQVVEQLLQTDDTFYQEAKNKRSPRAFRSVPEDHATDGKPSKALLLHLAKPFGAVRHVATDALGVEDRLLALPPRARERQVELDRQGEQLKARFNFNARENRTKEEKRAATETLEEMPLSNFRQILRQEAKRAASEELSVKVTQMAQARRKSPPARESPTKRTNEEPYPLDPGRPLRHRAPLPIPNIRHARAAGGLCTMRAVPKYAVDVALMRPKALTPPPRLPPLLPQAPTDVPHEPQGFCVPVDLKPRKSNL